jgi:hypothetical protein
MYLVREVVMLQKTVTSCVVVAACACILTSALAQQPTAIGPVDFRPFSDGMHWIVKEPMVYTVGISTESVTVPVGFVTDLASIPPQLHSIIQQNGPYILPAVMHDYLYWKQTCTRSQSDKLFLLAMIENNVSKTHRTAIFDGVSIFGRSAWGGNTAERKAHMLRIIPAARFKIPLNTSWSVYRDQLMKSKEVDGPDGSFTPGFCARGEMSVQAALNTP